MGLTLAERSLSAIQRLGLLRLLLLRLGLTLGRGLLLDVLVVHGHRLVDLELQCITVIDTARLLVSAITP